MNESSNETVVRIARADKYNVTVGGVRVVATPTQEERIRSLTPEQLDRFRDIMGGGR